MFYYVNLIPRNIGCLFPNSTIPACNNTEEVSDAISTHKAILKVLNPCTKTWPVPNDGNKYKIYNIFYYKALKFRYQI